MINVAKNNKAISLLKKSDKTVFFAVGETAYVAHGFAYMMNAIDQKSYFFTYENQVISEVEKSPGVLLFIVSLSGVTNGVLRVAKAAQKQRQNLISLTNLAHNPLADMADVSLFCYDPPRRWNGYNITDKAPLYIPFEALFEQYLQEPV